MHRLNVRCCCQPQKILGTIELASLSRRQYVYIHPEYPSFRDCIDRPNEIVPSMQPIIIELRNFFDPAASEFELAVYSDDRPIEFWRKFPGFKENSNEPTP
jgi:hypothetical protein